MWCLNLIIKFLCTTYVQLDANKHKNRHPKIKMHKNRKSSSQEEQQRKALLDHAASRLVKSKSSHVLAILTLVLPVYWSCGDAYVQAQPSDPAVIFWERSVQYYVYDNMHQEVIRKCYVFINLFHSKILSTCQFPAMVMLSAC